jgi:hypothetical protein
MTQTERIVTNPLEAIALWVWELRNTKVEQCTNNLAMGERRCCLGIASDLAIRHGVPVIKQGDTYYEEDPAREAGSWLDR